MSIQNHNGLLAIISSPSGGGKDSVIQALLKIFPSSTRLITTTSRLPRPGNQEGVDYYFISQKNFEKKIKRNEFVEYNVYAGNYYGTEKRNLENTLANFALVITQIEVNGKHNLDRARLPHLSIFLLPENLEVLRRRIEKRGGISTETIEKRLDIAKKEIEQSADYDYRIINYEGQLQETIKKIAKIIQAQLDKGGNIDKNSLMS